MEQLARDIKKMVQDRLGNVCIYDIATVNSYELIYAYSSSKHGGLLYVALHHDGTIDNIEICETVDTIFKED